ncbi:uncharacterized protein C2orf16 homolog [Dromiciops gliroides]|uniref:uncharacterized protein C2orf16 homolog n=1 Tax=Dromiciops gliroides TaxID=33562 RepID=UPI001CC389DE|nr:uncharacterized protein C2orf16 homolog [Dromiciops gliroides]
MELILGPGPPLPPPFSLLLLLGLLVIGVWSLLPGVRRRELLSAKIGETLRQQKVPGNQKVTKVPPPHWEDTLQMGCTGADLACFSGLPVSWAQNYTLWSMDRSLQHIFQHLDIARSSFLNLSLSSQVTSTPSSSSSTTGPQDLQTLTYECHRPGFSGVQRTSSLHTNLSATQSLAYIFRDSLEHRSHSLPNPSKNYSGQERVLSLPPFLLPQAKKDTTGKNIFLDNCTCNSIRKQRFCETKAEEEENDSWPPKETRNSLELHIRRKLAQRLAHPSIFRTIKLSIRQYPLADSPSQEKKTTKKREGNRVLKVSNPLLSSNLRERPRLPCWAPFQLSHSARWVLEGHMAWKVCTLRAQKVPTAVKQSWAMMNCVIKVQNEGHKSGSPKIQAPVSFPQNIVKGTNKKSPDVSSSQLPMDLETDQTRPTTPKSSKADSQPQPRLVTKNPSFSGVDVIPGEATFLQEDVKKRLELCTKKKVNCLLKKAIRQQKEALKEDEKLSIRLKLQVVDTMTLLQTMESGSLGGPGSQVQIKDSKGLTPESRGQVIDSLRLNSGPQVQKPQVQDTNDVELTLMPQKQDKDSMALKGPSSKVQDMDSVTKTLVSWKHDADSMELTPGSLVQDVASMGPTPQSQIKNVDSVGLIPGSQVKPTDSKGLVQGSQVKLTYSKGLAQGSQVKLTDSKGLTPGSQVTLIDSKGLIPASEVKLTDSKGLTPGSQAKLIDSKGLTPGSQAKLTYSKSLIPVSQVKSTDSKGLTPGSQVKLTDSKGLMPGSQVILIDSKGLTPGSQIKSTDSKGLTPGSQVKLTDSKGLTPGSQVKLTDSKGLMPGSQVILIDSKGLTPGSQIKSTDSKGLTPCSQVKLTDSKGLTQGSQVKLIDSKGLMPGSQVKLTDSMGLIPESQVKLTDSKGLTPVSQLKLIYSKGLTPGSEVRPTESKVLTQGSRVKLTDSKGLIPGSEVKPTDSKGLIPRSEVRPTDSKGLIPGSQVKPTDSKGLTQGSQVKLTDSKGVTSGSQVKLKDSKGLTLKPHVQVIDSVELTPWPRIQVVDSLGLTSRSKIQVIDPNQLTLELQSPTGDSFHLIQGSTLLYILGSSRIAAKLKQGDLNENIVLQKPFILRMSSKFSNTAQPSSLPRPLSEQPSHSLHQCLFQAPLLPLWKSENSFCQDGLRTPRALKWQVKAWEQRISKGRMARRKSSSTSFMLKKNLWAKMQQAHHTQEAHVQSPPQVPCPHAPNWHFVPPRQLMASQSQQGKIMGTPPRTSFSVNYIQRDTPCQLCRENLPFNEQLENSRPSTSQDYPNLTTKEAQGSSEPMEGRKEREQVLSELSELPQSLSPQLPSSHKVPSTEKNPASVEQKEKPDVSSQIRTSESQHKPLSVTSSHEQTQLLQDLQLKITKRLLKNQLSPHFTPSLTTGMVLQYPICLQCGRCSGPSCPHKFHDSVGPWLLIYPQLRLFRNSEGHGEFRVDLGFRLRTRTQTPKQQREVGHLVSMRHGSSQPDPKGKRKGNICTCHVTKKNFTRSPYSKTDLGPEPFQTPKPSQTPGPIQVHIKRNLPGRRVEVAKAESGKPEQYDFKVVHSLLDTDTKGTQARGEARRILNSKQVKIPKEIRTTTQKTERVPRHSTPKVREPHPERRTMEAQKVAPPSRNSEKSTGFMQWLCLNVKRALGMAHPPMPSLQQMHSPRGRPPRQQGSVFPEQSPIQHESKNEGKQWIKSLKTSGLVTKMERRKPEGDGKKRDTLKPLHRVPKSIKINQSRAFLKPTPKSRPYYRSIFPRTQARRRSDVTLSSYPLQPLRVAP